MVQIVEDLVEFVVDRIARHGSRGANLQDVQEFIKEFNQIHRDPGFIDESNGRVDVDEKYAKYILGLVSRSTSVRRHRQVRHGNGKTKTATASNTKSTSEAHHEQVDQTSTIAEEHSNAGAGIPKSALKKPQASANPPKVVTFSKHVEHQNERVPTTQDGSRLRKKDMVLTATKSRQKQVSQGFDHGVDISQLQPMEVKLLHIIAAHGEGGILQPQLTKLSGQDKRSVPQRTGRMAKYGVIEKAPVSAKGGRTSLLTLQKFVRSRNERRMWEDENKSQQSKEPPQIFRNGVLLLDRFLDAAIRITREAGQISLLKFFKALGIQGDRWKCDTVTRCLYRLELCGCVERVDLDNGLQGAEKGRLRSIKFLKEPDAKARKGFNSWAGRDAEKLYMVAHGIEDPEETQKRTVKRSALKPRWRGNGNLFRSIFALVNEAGPKGISSMDLAKRLGGKFWKKPAENAIARLTDSWQTSQPPHVRRFAIIRDSAQTGKHLHYQYRTYQNFERAAQQGMTSWQVVSNGNPPRQPKRNRTFGIPTYDKLGFPTRIKRGIPRRDAGATALRLRRLVKANALKRKRGGEPREGPQMQNSRKKIQRSKPAAQTARARKGDVLKKNAPNPVPKGPRGRPRKYKKGEEPYLTKNKASVSNVETGDNDLAQPERDVTKTAKSSETHPGGKNSAAGSDINREQSNLATSKGKKRVAEDQEPSTNDRPQRQRKKSKKSEDAQTPTENVDYVDISAPGVYINPTSRMPKNKGRPRKRMLVVIKSDRLRRPTPSEGGQLGANISDIAQAVETSAEQPQTSSTEAQKDVLCLNDKRESLDSTEHGTIIAPSHRTEKSGADNNDAATSSEASVTTKVYINPVGRAPPRSAGRRKKRMLLVIESSRLKELPSFRSDVEGLGDSMHVSASGQMQDIRLAPTSLAEQAPEVISSRADFELHHSTGEIEMAATHAPIAMSSVIDEMELDAGQDTTNPRRSCAVAEDESVRSDVSANQAMDHHPVQKESLEAAQVYTIGPLNLRNDGALESTTQSSVECDATSGRPNVRARGAADEEDAILNVEQVPAKNQYFPAPRKQVGKRPGVNLYSGNVAQQRSKLIIKIVEDAGGIYPGDRELSVPFVEAWQKKHPEQKPDKDTVLRAMHNVVNAKKLNRIGFSFKSQGGKGATHTKHILLQNDIPFDSPKVREMKLAIAKAFPKYHLPSINDASKENTPSEQSAASTPLATGITQADDTSSSQPAPNTHGAQAETSRKRVLPAPFLKPTLADLGLAKEKLQPPSKPAKATARKPASVASSSSRKRKAPIQRSNKVSYWDSITNEPEEEEEEEICDEQKAMQGWFHIPGYEHEMYPGQNKRGSKRRKISESAVETSPRNEDSLQAPDGNLTERVGEVLRISDRQPPARVAEPITVQTSYLGSSKAMLDFSLTALNCPAQDFHRQTGTFSTRFLPGLTSNPAWNSGRGQDGLFSSGLLPVPPRKQNKNRLQLTIQPNLHKEFENQIPSSLEDLLSRQNKSAVQAQDQDGSENIDYQLNAIQEWEEDNSAQLTSHQQLARPRFINVSVPLTPNISTPPAKTRLPSARKARPSQQQVQPKTAEQPRVLRPLLPAEPAPQALPSESLRPDSISPADAISTNPQTRQLRPAPKPSEKAQESAAAVSAAAAPATASKPPVKRKRGGKQTEAVNFADRLMPSSRPQDQDLGAQQQNPDEPASKRRRKNKAKTIKQPKAVPPSDLLAVERPEARNSNSGANAISIEPATAGPDPMQMSTQTDNQADAPTQNAEDLPRRRLSEKEAMELINAVVAVRTVAGGENMKIRWDIIQKIFPDRKLEIIKKRYARARSTRKDYVEDLIEDFQDKFIEAHRQRIVPRFNPNKPKDHINYDWEFVLNWMKEGMKLPGDDEPIELPPTRELFDKMYTLYPKDPDREWNLREDYFSPATTMKKRREAVNLMSGVHAQESSELPGEREAPSYLSAKTLVRANMLTPQTKYDGSAAQSTLASVDESLLQEAVEELLNAKLLKYAHKGGRIVPGRNYAISEQFFKNISRGLGVSSRFQGAVRYKQKLDVAFATDGFMAYEPRGADVDGSSVTISSLSHLKWVTIRPQLPRITKNPEKKPDYDKGERSISLWGWAEKEGKKTKIDKRAYEFSLQIVPTALYQPGLPTVPANPPPPPGAVTEGEENISKLMFIPAWYDIHGYFLPHIWRPLVSAILTSCLFRAVVHPATIAKHTCKGSVEAWEVRMALEYLSRPDVGAFAKKVEEGHDAWTAGDFWWACFGDGADEMIADGAQEQDNGDEAPTAPRENDAESSRLSGTDATGEGGGQGDGGGGSSSALGRHDNVPDSVLMPPPPLPRRLLTPEAMDLD